MQCAACRAVYSNALESCPRCKTPVSPPSPAPEEKTVTAPRNEVKTSVPQTKANQPSTTVSTPAASTLIEFPGTGRAARPQWRKELSERVREIQQRRAMEAAREAEEAARCQAEQPIPVEQPVDSEALAPQLELVPPRADGSEVNPLVAAALRRIERARQQSTPSPAPRITSRGGAAAAAVARVAEESVQREAAPPPVINKVQAPPRPEPKSIPAEKIEKPVEPARPAPASIAVIPAQQVAKVEPAREPVASKPVPRKVISEVVDDAMLARREAERAAQAAQAVQAAIVAPPDEEIYDDRPSLVKRFVGGIADLLVVAFVSSPFAAIIELTNGNWADTGVAVTMCSIVILVMFLYMTASIALTGRTWGMFLVSVRAIDAETGLSPTIGQSARRTLVYMLSLVTLGLGTLYALFDAEGRAVHDHLSGTITVYE